MTLPTSPQRRKARMVRNDSPPDDTLLLLRAATADPARNLRNVVSDATESGRTYAIERADGRREVLYGVSVYAQRPGQDVAEVLHRFSRAPCYVAVNVVDLRRAGLGVIDTGTNPDHYDVQLVAGRFDDDTGDDPEDELRGAAARFLWAASSPTRNPAYAGEPEEE